MVLACTYGLYSTHGVATSIVSSLECVVLEGKSMSSLCCYKQAFVDGWSSPCLRGKSSMAWWLTPRLVTRVSVNGKLGEQAWLIQVPCLARLAPEECDLLDKLGGQAWLM